MSFGELGYRMNYGQMMGNPYGGLGSINYGFGSGIVPGYGGAQSVLLYNSAYNTPGTGPGMVGIYPPWAAIGTSNQNPAIFPPGSPNYPGFVRSPRAYRPVPGRR